LLSRKSLFRTFPVCYFSTLPGYKNSLVLAVNDSDRPKKLPVFMPQNSPEITYKLQAAHREIYTRQIG